MRTSKRLPEVAYHEAGHAVATCWAGFTLQDINIVPEITEKGDLIVGSTPMDTGYLDHTNPDKDELSFEIHWETIKVVVCCLSGGIAEERFTGYASSFLHDDIQMVDVILKQNIRTEEVQKKLLKESQEIAEKILNCHWEAVDSLAMALIERRKIPADEVKKIIESALEK